MSIGHIIDIDNNVIWQYLFDIPIARLVTHTYFLCRCLTSDLQIILKIVEKLRVCRKLPEKMDWEFAENLLREWTALGSALPKTVFWYLRHKSIQDQPHKSLVGVWMSGWEMGGCKSGFKNCWQ